MSSLPKLVSVVTVTLNDRDNLLATLQSVESQSYENVEHILIDGGSTDGTLEYLSRVNVNSRKVISEPDDGIFDAMNKGTHLTAANSHYTIFMNAGDTFSHSDVVSDVINASESNASHLYGDIAIHGCQVKSSKTLNHYKLSNRMVCHQSFFFLTDSLRRFPYDTQYKCSADYKLLLQLLDNGECFEHIDLVVANYDTSGVSSRHRDKVRQERKHIRRYFPKARVWYTVKQSLNQIP